ncbi:MAG: acyl-[acyl-carrier-protein] thioesterase [Clostridia bacterium]
MSVYSEEILLRSKDVDLYRRLRLSRLFELLQEASIRHTEQLGMGREKTLDKGLLWVVTMQRCEIERLPEYDERITLSSWPGQMMHVFFPRWYRIADERDNTLLSASALWMLVDQQTRKMVFPDEWGVEIAGVTTGREIRLPSGLKKLPCTEEADFTVPFSYVDLNGHMNNTRYFDLAEDHIPAAAEGKRLRAVSTEYTAEARFRDELTLRWGREDGRWYMEGSSDKPCFRLSMEYEA